MKRCLDNIASGQWLDRILDYPTLVYHHSFNSMIDIKTTHSEYGQAARHLYHKSILPGLDAYAKPPSLVYEQDCHCITGHASSDFASSSFFVYSRIYKLLIIVVMVSPLLVDLLLLQNSFLSSTCSNIITTILWS